MLFFSAKDLATGKSQQIVIQSSGGLNEEDIEKMIKEAELKKDQDEKKKSEIETRNELDSLIHSSGKQLEEHKEKISDELKNELQAKIEEANGIKDSGSVEDLKQKVTELNEIAMKIGQVYFLKK